MIKRLFDVISSSLLLLILLPVFLGIALCIRWNSPGPIFFRQTRVGQFGNPFNMFKFRTMYMGAEQFGALTIGHDPRITTVGQFLRRYKLDELPQLIDVLRGTMSLVGPRPEVAKYVAHYPALARTRILSLRPGMTDWASIQMLRENQLLATVSDPEGYYIDHILPEKMRYYLHYAAHHTLLGDLKILCVTLYRILSHA